MGLGKKWSSDDHIISVDSGKIVRVRDARPEVDSKVYVPLGLLGVRGTPSNPSALEEDGTVHREVPRAPVPRPDEPPFPPKARRVILPRLYFEKFGYTIPGCHKCRQLISEDSSSAVGHSELCRTRIEDLMRKDEKLREGLDADDDRRDNDFAKDVERGAESTAESQGHKEDQKKDTAADENKREDGEQVDDDGIPELSAEDDGAGSTAPEPKRARMAAEGAATKEAEAEGEPGGLASEGEEEDAPDAKRARVNSSVGFVGSMKPDMWSGMIGRILSDEPARGAIKNEDPERDPHGETRKVKKGKHGSVYDVCEIFSPPQISRVASRQGLRAGWSLDLSTECPITGRKWDCRSAEDRAWVRKMVWRDKPKLLIVCPPCTLFSQLHYLSPNGIPPVRCPELWAEAMMMLEFSIEMCRIQSRACRGFVFEHPRTATSWEVDAVKRLAQEAGVYTSVFDMCRFGMTAEDAEGEGLVRKSTHILTNVEAIAEVLSVRCEGGHRHVHLRSGKAKAAQIYPVKMCEAIFKGLGCGCIKAKMDRDGIFLSLLEMTCASRWKPSR